MGKPNVLMTILKEVRERVSDNQTDEALRYLTQEGYLRWCEGKEIELSDIKTGYKTHPYTG